MAQHPQLSALAARWSKVAAKERSNAQLYLTELADALGVERPRPAGSGYEFERRVRIGNKDGTESVGHIDLFKDGHFVLEAKDEDPQRSGNSLLQRAFGQARSYALNLPGTPVPYLMVLDVGRTLLVWDRWGGHYGGFNAAKKVDLTRLHENPDDMALLTDIWERPRARDPRQRAQAVTKEIAAQLATVAVSLESRGNDQEEVARFLIRCVFTMFAEDIGLLPERWFERAIREVGFEAPEEFRESLEELWRAMDTGKRFGLRKLLRFNGHFFSQASALPLTHQELTVLVQAAGADWQYVEPSIFGTLLTRALDPAERHRLGAEYTPREFIERLVRPTVEEPIRDHWTNVQAEVLQLRERGKKADDNEALGRLRQFHTWLRSLRFLDPACGSGNFLYVTLAAVKRVELEVLRAIEEITGQPEMSVEEVGPWQFHGIEVKTWARELAELTLWIGYHQFWREHHGHVLPPEPVLRDTGTLELRDAVLAWDEIVRVPEKDRPDPTPRVPHPVTGKLVPDPTACLPYYEYRGARPASWPAADFIVGNPPFMGQFRQRDAFGDGYVDALRGAYPDVPDSADMVMYWWHKAAHAVSSGRTIRAGLITTQSITQQQNRKVIDDASAAGVRVTWAVADHYWNDGSDDARVRVAMTVIANHAPSATLVIVDGNANVVSTTRVPRLNSDLTAHADVATAAAVPLQGNQGLCSRGFQLIGSGFALDVAEAERLLAADPRHADIIRPYLNGKDLTTRPRGNFVIDFGLCSEEEARGYPVLYDLVRTRVKPERDSNSDRSTREKWWRFGRNREDLRPALEGLPRYIGTPETSKHRFFVFIDGRVAPDNAVVCIASADAFHLGVLSSASHSAWALAAGSRLGIDGTPRYNKGPCFEAFPFPDPPPALRAAIVEIAERLDCHRTAALQRNAAVTITGMYNVLEKLRGGTPLTPSERKVHDLAACGLLRDLHDELDQLVAEAYGWSWPMGREEILRRLVALHDERIQQESVGKIHWLRPSYQFSRFAPDGQTLSELGIGPAVVEVEESVRHWPASAIEQIAALKAAVSDAPRSVEEAASTFKGARRDVVERHLDTLVILGELRKTPEGRYQVAASAPLLAA